MFRREPDRSARFLLIRDSYRNWGFPKGTSRARNHPPRLPVGKPVRRPVSPIW